jgi:hypothetical protein
LPCQMGGVAQGGQNQCARVKAPLGPTCNQWGCASDQKPYFRPATTPDLPIFWLAKV